MLHASLCATRCRALRLTGIAATLALFEIRLDYVMRLIRTEFWW